MLMHGFGGRVGLGGGFGQSLTVRLLEGCFGCAGLAVCGMYGFGESGIAVEQGIGGGNLPVQCMGVLAVVQNGCGLAQGGLAVCEIFRQRGGMF